MVIDAIAARLGFPNWRVGNKIPAEITTATVDGVAVTLLKPTTYMNESGIAVAAYLRQSPLGLDAVTVFHDELDLEPSKVRIKRGGGAAGHNGLRSIDQLVGKDYRRVRLGIGHPGNKDLVSPYVLGNFSRDEKQWLEPFIQVVADAAPQLLKADESKFLNPIAMAMQQIS